MSYRFPFFFDITLGEVTSIRFVALVDLTVFPGREVGVSIFVSLENKVRRIFRSNNVLIRSKNIKI